MSHPKRMLTGLQPSGTLHLGNYFGSIKPYLDLVNEHSGSGMECFFMVADYHALTSVRDASALHTAIKENLRDYLAFGLDPEKVTIFQQSSNPDHLELAWVFNCLVSVPFLMQAHAYKDKVANGLDANAGLFTYPMLMAADIVLYNTDIVPVGEDQRQHVEYAREAVGKFTNVYGELLHTPQEKILPAVGVVPGLDGRKMSKSYHNTIPMFSNKDELVALCRKIVTDSDGSRPENVYAIHKLLRTESELTSLYTEHQGQYKILKDALAEDLDNFMKPLRDARASVTDADITSTLAAGNDRAREVSGQTMQLVRDRIGITI